MPTLGKTSIGVSPGAMSPNNEWAAGPYVASENGTITSISVYASSVGGGSIRLGVWRDTGGGYPGELVAESANQTLATGWMTFAATGPLVSGQSYYIGFLANNNVGGTYDSGVKEIVFKAKTFGALSNPFQSAGSEVGSRDYSMYLSYDSAPAESLTLDTPVARQLIQRNTDQEFADIAISGTALGFTGSIEARFAGGLWQTIATISVPGSFTGVLSSQSLTAGSLEVRSVTDTGINASVADVMCGRLYLVTGDSIAEGRLVNAQSRGAANCVAYRQDDAWVMADDPTDTGTNVGSHWPLLAQHLVNYFGCPVGFVTTATGSRDIAGGNADYFKPNVSGWGIIISQVAEAGGRIEAVLAHLGPNAASGDTLSEAQYLSALQTWAADIRADVQAGVPIYLGVYGRSNGTAAGNPKIRRAIASAIARGSFSCGPNYLGPNWSDGVHPRTDAEAALAAGRWFAAISGQRSPRIVKATLQTDPTKVDLKFAGTLGGNNGDTYTATLFSVAGVNPTTATRMSSNRVRLAFASAREIGQAFLYIAGEEHIGATMPTSPSVPLPVTLHGESAAVQPADPVQLSVTAERSQTEVWWPVVRPVTTSTIR